MRTIPWLLLAAGLVLAFLYLPSCYFTQDDLQNLSYYLERPAETATANLFFWSSTRRPLGGLVYLLLYGAFGLQAAPYYLLGALIWGANLALSYLLLLRISRERLLAITTISLVGIHPLNRSLWFNFGTIYELLALLFLLLTFHAYLKARECSSRNTRLLYTLLALLSFLLALNSKETAAAIPLLLLSYEALFADHPAAGWRRWKIGLGRTLPFLALTFPYVLGKITGEEAFWRDNAAYQYQFDLTPLRNLVDYMGILFGSSHQLGAGALLSEFPPGRSAAPQTSPGLWLLLVIGDPLAGNLPASGVGAIFIHPFARGRFVLCRFAVRTPKPGCPICSKAGSAELGKSRAVGSDTGEPRFLEP